MRWRKYIIRTNPTRCVKRFLFWPTWLGDEIRWLEFAWIEQGCFMDQGHWGWVNQRFIDY